MLFEAGLKRDERGEARQRPRAGRAHHGRAGSGEGDEGQNEGCAQELWRDETTPTEAREGEREESGKESGEGRAEERGEDRDVEAGDREQMARASAREEVCDVGV